jgi:hypothetical protein
MLLDRTHPLLLALRERLTVGDFAEDPELLLPRAFVRGIGAYE